MARKNKDVWVAEATKLEIAQRHMVSENNDMRAKILALEAERDKWKGRVRTWVLCAWLAWALIAVTLAIVIVERFFA